MLQTKAISFDITKCDDPQCQICKPPHILWIIFRNWNTYLTQCHGDDGHYKNFKVVFKTATREEHLPYMVKRRLKQRCFLFMHVQHICNTEMLQCEECFMWRLIYAKRKLKAEEKVQSHDCLWHPILLLCPTTGC